MCGNFSCGMLTLSCSMWALSCGMRDLVPRLGIEPGPPALGARSLTCWTTREIPQPRLLQKQLGKECSPSARGQGQGVWVWGQTCHHVRTALWEWSWDGESRVQRWRQFPDDTVRGCIQLSLDFTGSWDNIFSFFNWNQFEFGFCHLKPQEFVTNTRPN